MSKEPLSIRHVSLEEAYQDSLKTESCNIAPEIFWDEVQDSKRKTELDSTLCKEGHLSEPLFEDFIYDFEDASETLMSPLNTLRMCSMNEEPSFSTNSTGWKEYNEELLSQGKLAQQGRVLEQQQESSRMREDSNTKDSCELLTEVETPPKEFVVKRSDAPVREDPFLIMREPLLDCIVKESPIKEVSSFLTQPTGSLFQTNECSAGKDLLIQWDGSSAVEKTLLHEGTMMNSEQHNESAKEAGLLTVFPDALDENLDYIRTLIQSNRCLKEHLKSTLAHCINKEKVTECTSASPSAALVSKGDHNADEKSLPIHSTKLIRTAEECWQGDTGDKGIILPYTTKSCSLTPYEVSHKLCHGNPAEFTSKQLLLQEGDMDFNRVIKDLEEDHQQQLSCIVNLQYGNIFFEKKMKEMEKALLQEGVMDLNKALQGLQQDQKKQHIQIMDLYYDNVSLRRKIKELEVDFLKNCNFLNTIKELKGIITNLTEAKNQVIEEKNEAERQLKGKKDMLANKEDHLQDSESEKVTLMLQLEKLHADYNILQSKYQAEVEQKNQYLNQCTELNCALHKKEQEMQELCCVQQQLEHEVSCTTSALHKLRQEKDIAEKHLMSLQAEIQKQKSERQAEKEELSCRYNQLVAQIKTLQTEFENERAEMENMQKQVCAFQTKNSELQQQMAKDKEQNHFLMLEPTWWKEECDWIDRIRESQTVKEQMQYQMIQLLRHKVGLQQEELKKKEEIIEWKMHVLGRFLLDMKSMHSDLSIRSLHSDEDHFSSPYVHKASHLLSKIRSLLALTEGLLTCQDANIQTIVECSKRNETDIELKEKMKTLSSKKRALEKELQKHKENIAAIRMLIINGKSSEAQEIETAGAGDEELENGADLPDLLRKKLDEYHKDSDELHGVIKELEDNLAFKEEACKKVTGENDKLQKNLGSLMCKVTAYEEIIERADQRLELANSEISYLEKRNEDLEDLIKKFKMKTRKLRKRWSSFCSQMLIQEEFQIGGNHLVTKEQTIKYTECDCQCHSSKVCLQMTY